MHICKTLDYIVDTYLHLYFFVKLIDIRSKGIRVEIELTESISYIPIDSVKYKEMVAMVLDNVTYLLSESFDKKLNLYMFYTEGELHLVIQYYADKERSSKALDTALRQHNNFHHFTAKEKGITTQHLIVMP